MAERDDHYLLLSWNVNIYSDDVHQYLKILTENSRPDVIFLSETKKKTEYLEKLFAEIPNYNYIINAHDPSRWHGVVMLIRNDHQYEEINIDMNIPTRKDTNGNDARLGRVIAIKLENKYNIVGTYVPNSGSSKDEIKLNYRIKMWDPELHSILNRLQNDRPTLWMGDINVALDTIDVSNPGYMKRYAGFKPAERENFSQFLQYGQWIDVWRKQNPTSNEYTWCKSPPKENYGMRLDNIIVSSSMIDCVKNSFILYDYAKSADHRPVGIYINK